MFTKPTVADSTSPWQATVLTLFPDMFPGSLGFSLAGRALVEGKWNCNTVNIRDFGYDKHGSVDDTPSGGGAGMVMRPDVVSQAIESVSDQPGSLVYLSPRGKQLTQRRAKELSNSSGVKLICGRFEGLDQRVIDHYEIEEISVGDYVLSGGEIASMVLLDSVIRLLPGVMGNAESSHEESFENDLLEYPLYTRPTSWNGHEVPAVLQSGHHKNIAAWRLSQAEQLTKERRHDLWNRYQRHSNEG